MTFSNSKPATITHQVTGQPVLWSCLPTSKRNGKGNPRDPPRQRIDVANLEGKIKMSLSFQKESFSA